MNESSLREAGAAAKGAYESQSRLTGMVKQK
jgi:hypothetical protein